MSVVFLSTWQQAQQLSITHDYSFSPAWLAFWAKFTGE